MNLKAAPKPIVDLANAIFRNSDLDQAQQFALDFVDQLMHELSAYGDHFLSHSDQADYVCLLERLEWLREWILSDSADFVDALEVSRELVERLENFERERLTPHYVEILALDQLLVAGTSLLQGYGCPLAVTRRLPFARQCAARLRLRLNAALKEWGAEQVERLALHLEGVEHGLNLVEEATAQGRFTRLNSGLTRVREHASELTSLASAREREDSTQIIGLAELHMLTQSSHPHFTALAARYSEDFLPGMLEFWRASRECLLLPSHLVEAVTAEIDDAFAEMVAVFADGAEPEQTSQAAENLLYGLEFLHQHKLDLSTPVGSLRPITDALAGACLGGVADAELAELLGALHEANQPGLFGGVLGHLESYLFGEGQRLSLLAALESSLALGYSLTKARLASRTEGSNCPGNYLSLSA